MSSYEETLWCVEPGRDASVPRADLEHHELKSFGRFWYQEIRDFLNSKRTVAACVRKFMIVHPTLEYHELAPGGHGCAKNPAKKFLKNQKYQKLQSLCWY
jgi:hypothetical protein